MLSVEEDCGQLGKAVITIIVLEEYGAFAEEIGTDADMLGKGQSGSVLREVIIVLGFARRAKVELCIQLRRCIGRVHG